MADEAAAKSLPAARQRIGPILDALAGAYPDAACALASLTRSQLLVATILSAQCTDSG